MTQCVLGHGVSPQSWCAHAAVGTTLASKGDAATCASREPGGGPVWRVSALTRLTALTVRRGPSVQGARLSALMRAVEPLTRLQSLVLAPYLPSESCYQDDFEYGWLSGPPGACHLSLNPRSPSPSTCAAVFRDPSTGAIP